MKKERKKGGEESAEVRTPVLVLARVYARTNVLRGFGEFSNLTLPAGRIVLGGGPNWDSGAGAGAWATGALSTKLSIETPTKQKVSRACSERKGEYPLLVAFATL